MSRPDPSPPPPEPQVVDSLARRVRGLGCPNCGGALDVESGLRVVSCPFCATTLLVAGEIGIRRLAVEARVEAEKAREVARRWLTSGWSKDPGLRREGQVAEAFLCFLPFHRVEADVIGIALGTEKRQRTVGSGKKRRVETYEVDVERSVERSFDRTYPAVNVAEWGIRRVDLRGDPLVPFDPRALSRQGMVFPPTGSEAAVKRAAVEQYKMSADPSGGLHQLRFKFLESLRERLTVVYYPVWVVRYRFRQRSYQVLVDAEDGRLSYGKAPGNDVYRALMLVLTQAVALFVGTTAVRMGGGDPGALFMIGLPVLAALVWGWRRFRYGGVVIEGSGTRPEPGLGRSIRHLVDRKGRIGALTDLAAGRLPEDGR